MKISINVIIAKKHSSHIWKNFVAKKKLEIALMISSDQICFSLFSKTS